MDWSMNCSCWCEICCPHWKTYHLYFQFFPWAFTHPRQERNGHFPYWGCGGDWGPREGKWLAQGHMQVCGRARLPSSSFTTTGSLAVSSVPNTVPRFLLAFSHVVLTSAPWRKYYYWLHIINEETEAYYSVNISEHLLCTRSWRNTGKQDKSPWSCGADIVVRKVDKLRNIEKFLNHLFLMMCYEVKKLAPQIEHSRGRLGPRSVWCQSLAFTSVLPYLLLY